MGTLRYATTLATALAALLVIAPSAGAWNLGKRVSFYGGASGTESSRGPVVGLDSAGRATVVWSQTETGVPEQWSIRRAELATLNGDWSAPALVSGNGATYTPDEGRDPELALAVSPGGQAAAAWLTVAGGVQAVTRTGATGGFGSPITLTNNDPGSACQSPTDPSGPIVTSGSGAGHVMFIADCGLFYSVLARPIGSLVTGHNIEIEGVSDLQGGSKVGPHAAFKASGGISRVIYTGDIDNTGDEPGNNGGPTATSLSGSTKVANSTKRYHDDASNDGPTRIAFLPTGNEIAVWRQSDDGQIHVNVGGSSEDVLSQGGASSSPEVAAGADGTAVVTWFEGGKFWASVMPHPGAPGSGIWGPPHALSESAGNPHSLRLAVAANGLGYAVWIRDDGANQELEASILDPLDPNRSPGKPWRFQPVADQIFEGFSGQNNPLLNYGWSPPSIGVDPKGNAVVTAAMWVDGGYRYTVVAIVNHTPRPTKPPPPVDKKKPVISSATLKRGYMGPGSKEGKIIVKSDEKTATGGHGPLRAGTKIRFTLSEAAKVTISIKGAGCWYDRKKENLCKPDKVNKVVFRKKIDGALGKNSLTFLGKGLLKGKHMVPGGSYEVKLVAVDKAGNKSFPKFAKPKIRYDEPR